MPTRTPITRLAPSPTGALHLGNARTFLVNWALARRNGWKVLLRMDDLEGPRVKPGAAVEAVEDLRWLGLDWGGELPPPTTRVARYEEVLGRLIERGCCFACTCSRSRVLAESPKSAADGSGVYGGRCRSQVLTRDDRSTDASVRVRFADDVAVLRWPDGVENVDATRLGDFVLRRADGAISYQLASAVDDLDADVTHVVRGDDLRDSSARQTFLRNLLAPDAPPLLHVHLPLIVGPDGRKLAKRHGDTRLTELRRAGWSPGRVRALLARWSGIGDLPETASAEAWADAFDLGRMPPSPIVFDPREHEL